MTIIIKSYEENVIETLEVDGNPFRKGEILHLEIENRVPEVYKEVEPSYYSYRIEEIAHYHRITYSTPKVYTAHVVEITVSKLEE